MRDPVGSWIEGCPRSWRDITIHHLLVHTSGLGHWDDMPEIDVRTAMDPAEQIAIVQRQPLRAEPGAAWYYSSWAISCSHTLPSGRPTARTPRSWPRQEIFAPLGMADTFAGTGSGHPELAAGYADGKPTPSYELDRTNMGAGDVWSTVDDLARWDAAVTGRALLSEASWAASLTGQARTTYTDGAVTAGGYGYGWVTGTVGGHGLLFHTGGNAGFRTLNAVIPGLSARIVILSNDEAIDIDAVSAEALAAALP